MLTESVVELTIETYQEVKVIPGQWALFKFQDEQWSFQRSYSIVDQDTDNEKTMLVFIIKLLEQGRGSSIIRNIHIGNEVLLTWIFWKFVLQNTQLPKVFIWTWVGISPLLNMAKYCTTEKKMFFSVSYKKDLFYEDKIKKINGITYDIHISRETIPEYSTWRINLLNEHFDPITEFYICGKGETVDAIKKNLSTLGYKNIYTENF